MNDRSSSPIRSCMHLFITLTAAHGLHIHFTIIVLPFNASHRCLTAVLFLRIGCTVVDVCIINIARVHYILTRMHFLHDAIYKIKYFVTFLLCIGFSVRLATFLFVFKDHILLITAACLFADLHSEIRMQERVFMGIGHKPFMDIQPSEMAINDRAINCCPTGRGEAPAMVKRWVA